ncbi:MAG: LysR family transcriptional regulator [Oscillospiraceae bacterium]|nr:LysR family transcriptional regulator [Oscillospiraceae bacterium]
MEYSQIKYFITAAQTQNLTKAAQILNITQSALSKSISNLEDELGVLLFDRTGKKVTLNESGRKFLSHAISSVRELDLAVSAAQVRDERPVLHIGLFHYSGKFMQCLKEFSKAQPNAIIRLDYLEVKTFSIDTNEYDMLLFPQSPLFRRYKAKVAYSEPYFLAVHNSHPLAARKDVCLSDLSSQKFIFIKQGDEQLDLPYHLCTSLYAHVKGDIFTNSYEMQRWLISNNHGIGFVPQGSAEAYALDHQITLLPIQEEGMTQEIMIGFKRGKHTSSIGKLLAEFVSDYFDGLPQDDLPKELLIRRH